MSLRLKLILSFVTASLAAVSLFATISYSGARDYAHYSEMQHVHENNRRVINMTDGRSPEVEQIIKMIPHHETKDSFFLLLERDTGKIANINHASSHIKTAKILIRKIGNIDKPGKGLVTINNENYFWAADTIPKTPYLLLNTFHHTDSGIAKFFDHMGLVLGISVFVALWLSFWAATILANLYQRLANQKMEIEHQSRHDPLTSLPNRHTIGEIIEESINTNNDEIENVLLCLVDVNGLKDVNDSLGHEYGDELLRDVSERLKETLRTSDRVGRFGGDKFAVVLKHSKNTAIEELCTRLLTTFDRAFQIKGHSLYLGATLGIACYPEHAEDSPCLIQKAEIALHSAKDASKDFLIFDVNKNRRNPARLNLANDLRHAIREGQLSLYYQPQLDLRSGKIVGVEALARWNHPEHGFIPPDTFIAIAERTGLIKQLTEFVLTSAVKQCAEWRRTVQSLAISINLSARNLHDETLPKQVARLIRHWKIIPEQICLEITETAMMADPEHAGELLEELDRLGVRISIDDFGTGYSSLTYLKKLPVDEIKIDKSFVMNMNNSENDASIVRATVGLAHDLGLSVVAEGVENQESQETLKAMGCQIAQGYHVCEPATAEEITKFLAQPISKKAKQRADSPSQGYGPGPFFRPI